jgi:hypothetical protein
MQNFLNEQDAIIFKISRFTKISHFFGVTDKEMLEEEKNPSKPVL